jgi:hypothetical protein
MEPVGVQLKFWLLPDYVISCYVSTEMKTKEFVESGKKKRKMCPAITRSNISSAIYYHLTMNESEDIMTKILALSTRISEAKLVYSQRKATLEMADYLLKILIEMLKDVYAYYGRDWFMYINMEKGSRQVPLERKKFSHLHTLRS